jgi:hypothetical protein
MCSKDGHLGDDASLPLARKNVSSSKGDAGGPTSEGCDAEWLLEYKWTLGVLSAFNRH